MSDVRRASEELSAFKDKKPLRYYGDDVTTEKLVSMISENDGRAAIFSPEGGIFDLLKGMYTRYVNIDVFLKGYSGDPIRVDRIGRESETICIDFQNLSPEYFFGRTDVSDTGKQFVKIVASA